MNRLEQVLRAAVCGIAAGLAALTLGACGGSSGAGARAPTATVNVPASTAAGGGAASGSGAASGGAAAPGSSTVTTAGAGGTQATATSVARSPSLNHLQTVLEREAATLGAGSGSAVGIDVEDLSTGQTLYSRDAESTHPPASLEKLYTSSALLWLLGPDARLHTELLGTGYLFAGVWHGNLYLRGDGDPTFGDGNWNELYEDGYGPTAAQLIAQMRRDGIKRVTGRLYADASRFDSREGGAMTADAPDPGDYGGEMSALVYDHGLTLGKLGPAATTVHQVAVAARQSGLAVLAAPRPATTPVGAKPLATLASPPMSTMLGLMLVPSDDLFADLFAKQLGFHFYGRGTLSLGALAIRGAITQHYALSPTIHDGSGLDRTDRSSPADFLSLLRQMYRTPVGNVVRAGLPVVARSGTVQDIGVKTAAAGHCEAKTGTLNNVTNLAGYCSARGGDTLAFAFMVDGPPNDDSEYAFTPMVGAVARY